MTITDIHQLSLFMLFISGVILFLSLMIRLNHGLILARTTYQLKKYRYDTAHKSEREIGNKISSVGVKIGIILFVLSLVLFCSTFS
jgi:hypothetical protein